MIVFTSAKSRLIRPGTRIRSEIPWIACRSTSSAVANASVSGVVRSMIVEQPLVRDRDDRVDAVAQRLEAALGLHLPLLAFELERLGDDRDRQRAELAREAGDDRRRAGAGAAAEPGRDEDHVGAVERLDDLVGVLERRLSGRRSDRRRRRAPWSACRRSASLTGAALRLQRLQVGVGDDELDAVESGLHHAVDGVAAAAADADHLDARAGVLALRRAAAAAVGAASSSSSAVSVAMSLLSARIRLVARRIL